MLPHQITMYFMHVYLTISAVPCLFEECSGGQLSPGTITSTAVLVLLRLGINLCRTGPLEV